MRLSCPLALLQVLFQQSGSSLFGHGEKRMETEMKNAGSPGGNGLSGQAFFRPAFDSVPARMRLMLDRCRTMTSTMMRTPKPSMTKSH